MSATPYDCPCIVYPGDSDNSDRYSLWDCGCDECITLQREYWYSEGDASGMADTFWDRAGKRCQDECDALAELTLDGKPDRAAMLRQDGGQR